MTVCRSWIAGMFHHARGFSEHRSVRLSHSRLTCSPAVSAELVLRQHTIDGIRVPWMIQDKAQSEEKGRSLVKDCNAVLDHPGHSL